MLLKQRIVYKYTPNLVFLANKIISGSILILMYYYEVQPATNKYRSESKLVYSFAGKLKKGQIVEIQIRKITCLATVENEVSKPAFQTSGIKRKINELSLSENQRKLFNWFRDYYPESSGPILKLFIPPYLEKYEAPEEIASRRTSQIDRISPKLNKEQTEAYQRIMDKADGTFLLKGVTGSGKTRLYLELARDQINSGKSVLVLTPEIALTAPLEIEFKSIFKDMVITNHSNLTQKQKLNMYQKIFRSRKPLIIIGPRSSLFLPMNNLGLIIVDEAHESSYKQESSPRYLANRVASKLSQITGSKLLFGSATPSVSEYYIAEQKDGTILNLYSSAITGKPPKVHRIITNLSNKDEQTSYPLISKTVLSEISKSLDKKEQVLVYINRRGSFRAILCKECGWQLKCPHCELPLIYHEDLHLSVCHTCGYKTKPPMKCPECNSIDISFISPGTKTISSTLSNIFPDAKVKRYDKDNKKNERIENNFEAISAGDVDIIVGTQMVSKGFDLPKLSLVVMLITEDSLNFPDYTSNERSYQLVTQLSGRVNRGHREGKIILQTFSPENEAIKYSGQNWIDFYKEELEKRKSLGFPPFWNALKIQTGHKSRAKAESIINESVKELNLVYKNLKILGPSPSFIEKKLNKFHWQAIILSKDRRILTEVSRNLPDTLKKDLDPVNFL